MGAKNCDAVSAALTSYKDSICSEPFEVRVPELAHQWQVAVLRREM
jgi:hypothetical protein